MLRACCCCVVVFDEWLCVFLTCCAWLLCAQLQRGIYGKSYCVCACFACVYVDADWLLGCARAGYGFEKPSVIQQKAIMPVISGRDTIAQAQSGTGKTGTFSISVLQRIDFDQRVCQVSFCTCCANVPKRAHIGAAAAIAVCPCSASIFNQL